MPNFFDQFDQQPAGGNFFDQFDAPPPASMSATTAQQPQRPVTSMDRFRGGLQDVLTGSQREMMAAEQRVIPAEVMKNQPLGEVLSTDAGDNLFYADPQGQWQQIDLKRHVILPDQQGRRMVYPATPQAETNLLDATGRIARETLMTTPPGSVLRMSGLANKAATPAQEFGIPLSRGQATGKFRHQAFEQSAAAGAKGNLAEATMRRFNEIQGRSVESARAGIGRFGSTGESADSITAAEKVMTKARTLATANKKEITQMYQKALSQRASIKSENLQSLPAFITAHMDKEGVFVDDLTPAAKAAVKDIEELAAFKPDRLAGSRPGVMGDGQIVAVSMEAINRTRRKIGSRIGAAQNATDRMAATTIKRAFDEWRKAAVTNGLFEGSSEALSDWIKADKAYSEYAKMFKPQGRGDDAGRIIEAIVTRGEGADGAKTVSEIANYMYGASQVGVSGTSVRLAVRLKRILGEGSGEFRAVKQGLWERLTTKAGTPFGPEAMSNRIMQFLDGNGRTLARQVYTSQELANIRRFAQTMKTLVPTKDATNPSKSGYAVARDVWSSASNMLGLGGAVSAASGEPTGAALAGINILGKLKNAISASRAVNYPPPGITGRSVPAVSAGTRGQDD